MLKITGLKKSYKRHKVLKDLNMNIEKGDIYGLIGTNGCGKTTTMNIICNIIPKDEGEIAFESESPKIGFLPESPSLFGYLNGREYLDYIGACCKYDGDINARTQEVLKKTGMTDGAKRQIRGYSRGMKQRIGIAAAIYADPELLILDEPTSALDPEGRSEVMEIIKQLSSGGSTIILCTHILTDIERVANKVGILKNGLMAVEGTIPEVKKKFQSTNAVTIKLSDPPDETHPILKMDNLESYEISQNRITLYSTPDVSEAEHFYKAATMLAQNRILPEAIELKRMSLEQIYIGINNGTLQS